MMDNMKPITKIGEWSTNYPFAMYTIAATLVATVEVLLHGVTPELPESVGELGALYCAGRVHLAAQNGSTRLTTGARSALQVMALVAVTYLGVAVWNGDAGNALLADVPNMGAAVFMTALAIEALTAAIPGLEHYSVDLAATVSQGLQAGVHQAVEAFPPAQSLQDVAYHVPWGALTLGLALVAGRRVIKKG